MKNLVPKVLPRVFLSARSQGLRLVPVVLVVVLDTKFIIFWATTPPFLRTHPGTQLEVDVSQKITMCNLNICKPVFMARFLNRVCSFFFYQRLFTGRFSVYFCMLFDQDSAITVHRKYCDA